MKKHYIVPGALILLFALFMSVNILAYAEETGDDSCIHDNIKWKQYEVIDSNTHSYFDLCLDCEEHLYSTTENHDFYEDYSEKSDDTYHTIYDVCSQCDYIRSSKEKHQGDSNEEYIKYNTSYHKEEYICDICGETYYVIKPHTWKKTTYKKVDNTYCQERDVCSYCGQIKTGNKVKHNLSKTTKVLSKATITKKGSLGYKCTLCKNYIPKSCAWKLGGKGCVNYDVKNGELYTSAIFTTDKVVKLKLNNVQKGSVIKIKMGNKVYTKKITNTNKTQNVSIKPTKAGTKYTIKVYYKNKLIGKSAYYNYKTQKYGIVFVRKPVKGLTMAEAKYIIDWTNGYKAQKISSDWIIWKYPNGAYIKFYKGKIASWKFGPIVDC